MNDFATELKELIERHREMPGTVDEDIVNALMDAIEEIAPHDDE